MPTKTPIIDAQVHAYERNHPGRPWAAKLHGPDSVTGGEMVAAMDAVGVDGAILVSSYNLYRYDGSYAVEVGAAHPGRFGLVKPVDVSSPGAAERLPAIIADWAATQGAVGIRVMLIDGVSEDAEEPAINRAFTEAARHGLPVNIVCFGRATQLARLAARHPDTVLVIDHLGLPQPFEPPVPANGWAPMEDILALAKCPNTRVKISGACTLSLRPYPFDDIWEPLARYFDAFGMERCMWGTDWTRAVAILSYREGVDASRLTDRLSEGDRAALMGGTLAKVYRWSPGQTQLDQTQRG